MLRNLLSTNLCLRGNTYKLAGRERDQEKMMRQEIWCTRVTIMTVGMRQESAYSEFFKIVHQAYMRLPRQLEDLRTRTALQSGTHAHKACTRHVPASTDSKGSRGKDRKKSRIWMGVKEGTE